MFRYGDYLDEDGDDANSCAVVLTISARNIRDNDMDSVSDPYCSVLATTVGGKRRKWRELGRTEVINNCLNPDWSNKIHLNYSFEDQQRLMFEVFDKGPPGKDTRLGSATLLLHEIIGAKYNRICTPLVEDGKQYGTITVTAEELTKGRQESVYFMCSATKLDKKDFLGKCDPFLKISRVNFDNTLQLAYRTRYREQNLNPKWKPFEIHIQQLCYGDKNRPFLIECFDWDQDGNHDLVGSCTTTVNRLISQQDVSLSFINEKKARKSKKYIDSGQLHFHKVYCWMDYSFLDFISAGTELDFIVAVDFTRSNLPMEEESSLHSARTSSANQYEIAIRSISEYEEKVIEAVGEICQHYNRSKLFHAVGFGARLPHQDRVHYNFPLNIETGDYVCEGIDGLLRAYRSARSRVQLSGPTDFAPTIRFAAKRAASLPQDGSKYAVLLIITDGVISDMERTKEEIVKASSLPLSIIIVGVGYDSFDEMRTLDGDSQLLSANGKCAKRDIVQFVQMRNFLPPHRVLSEEEVAEAKRNLAKEVLQEIPAQLTGHMKSRGIFPQAAIGPQTPRAMRHQQQNLQNGHGQQYHQNGASGQTGIHPHHHSYHGHAHASQPHQQRSGSICSDTPRTRRMLPQIPTEELRKAHIY